MERRSGRTNDREGKGPVRALLMIALFLALLWGGTGCFIAEYLTWKKGLDVSSAEGV